MKAIAMICAALVAVCGTVRAQSSEIKVHFANPVTVGQVVLPAGDFEIQRMESNTSTVLLELRSEAGRDNVLMVQALREPVSHPADVPSVVLARHGSAFLLEQIWLPDGTGFKVLE